MKKVREELEREWAAKHNDNWIHKSTEMTCGTCMYFNNMRCRRHCPTMQGFPGVYVTDWCGDHKLDKGMMHKLQEKR